MIIHRNTSAGSGGEVDYRDSKIVSLAKKIRTYTVQLNKEKAENENLRTAIKELNVFCDNLREEVSLIKE